VTGALFDYHVAESLPPLAWVARIAGGRADVQCGRAVRRTAGGFVEGSWTGDADVSSLASSTTVFGSGIVALDGELLVVPPSHQLEAVYSVVAGGDLIFSNSLVGLLTAAQLRLDPDANYPAVFGAAREGIKRNPISIPTLGPDVTMYYHENVRVGSAGSVVVQPKPREAAFGSFADYRQRLTSALASLVANAPGYRPVVALSGGYDSTAVAVIAASLGCADAVSFSTGRQFGTRHEVKDSGAATAQRLGLRVSHHDRHAYRSRSDLPEAEFLAGGMPGEEVALVAMADVLPGTMLLTGNWPAWVWAATGPQRTGLERDDLSAASLTEFRLRLAFVAAHLPHFGATAQPSLLAISGSEEMRPFRVGGGYDRPIPRRIAEEAGLPRGSFATSKRATSINLNRQGREAFAPATVRSIEAFALAEGRQAGLAPVRRIGTLERSATRLAKLLRAGRLAGGLERHRQSTTHFRRQDGALLLRWAVEQVRPRYSAVASGTPRFARNSAKAADISE
jgi:hypothetical protein